MPPQFTFPPDTRATGTGFPAADMDGVVDTLTAMGAVYNVLNAAYSGGADPTGTADSYAAIQGALTAARTSASGGTVVVPPGLYRISQSLQIGSNTMLAGAGMGVTTIRAQTAFSPTQVGNNTGAVMLAAFGNTAASNIIVSGVTFDGNQANVTAPGAGALAYADQAESAPVSLWNVTGLQVTGVSVINAVGYSLYLADCIRFWVTGCYILAGQTPATGYAQQDGIHMSSKVNPLRYGLVENNYVDTGTATTAGDDGIALQSFVTISDVEISGNMIRAGQSGIDVVLGGGSACTITNVDITGNTIFGTVFTGVLVTQDAASTGSLISNVTVTGNAFNNLGVGGTGGGYSGVALTKPFSGSTPIWKDVTISGNTFGAFTGPASLAQGIYAAAGSGLIIDGNSFGTFPGTAFACIEVGDAGLTVTGFTMTGNLVTCTAATAPVAVLIMDSIDGTVTGNTLSGTTSGASYGIHVLGSATAPTGLAVGLNRVKNFSIGAFESGSPAPTDNVYVANNFLGCSTTHTVGGAPNVVANNLTS
jgi:hypothetical protein